MRKMVKGSRHRPRDMRNTRALLRLVGLREPEFVARELSLIFKRHQKTIANVVWLRKWPHRIEPFKGRGRMVIPAQTVRLLAKHFGFPAMWAP